MYLIQNIIETDIPELAKLYDQLRIEKKKSEIAKMFSIYERINKDQNYYLLGAKTENGILVGSILGIICYDLIDNKPFMVMENMIVDNNWKRKGIGKLLLKKLEAIAIKHNCFFIQFCSSMFRKDAHEFYYSLGYKPDEVKGFRKWL